MKSCSLLLAVLSLFSTSLVAVPARAQSQGDVQLRTNEVLLDLVATDKKGVPVTDLHRDEIKVFENGEPQEVTSFGLVRVGARPGETAAAPSSVEAPNAIANSLFKGINLIIIIVDRTSVTRENLSQVLKSSEKFVNERLALNDMVAVFASTNRPVMMQNFTNNKPKLLEALKRATAGTSVQLQEATGDAARVDLASAQAAEAQSPQTTANANDDVADQRRNDLLENNAKGIDTAFAAIRDQIQALAIINSILTLTKVYGSVTGRKSIVLFSEGMTVSTESKAAFEAMIGAANRANFTINTVSAAGLSANAPSGRVQPRNTTSIYESRDRIYVQGGESGMDQLLKPTLNSNDEALNQLARETGGILVRNTNDLGKGFQSIENDLRSYYALSYSPTNTTTDGSFRSIEVRVARKDVDVRTRTGYYALPGGANDVLLPYEQPILAMITKATPQDRPADLAVALKTERFPVDGGWRVPVVVSVNGGELAPIKSTAANKPDGSQDYEVDAVVLIKDARQQVVAKLSRASIYRATPERAAEFKSSPIPLNQFGNQPVLEPGVYQLQAGVRDAGSKRGTVIERKITIPPLPPAGSPALGSLVLSTTAFPLPPDATASPDDALVFDGKTVVMPNPTGKFVKARGDRMILYFQLRAAPGAKYEMLVHFMAGDEVVLGTPASPLPPTDAQGRTAAAPVMQLDGFKPGAYRAILYIVPPGSKTPVAQAVTPFTVE